MSTMHRLRSSARRTSFGRGLSEGGGAHTRKSRSRFEEEDEYEDLLDKSMSSERETKREVEKEQEQEREKGRERALARSRDRDHSINCEQLNFHQVSLALSMAAKEKEEETGESTSPKTCGSHQNQRADEIYGHIGEGGIVREEDESLYMTARSGGVDDAALDELSCIASRLEFQVPRVHACVYLCLCFCAFSCLCAIVSLRVCVQ